jgi:drug/metabolite transporter (DMT)-like permease
MSARRTGIFWIVVSATGFGAMAIFAKLAYAEGINLSTMLFLRFTVAGLALAVWGSWRRMAWPRGRDLALLVAMGGLGYVGQAGCYFSALQYAGAGLVALLLYLYPAIVTLLSALRQRRGIGWGRLLAVTAALVGTALAVGADLKSEALGIGLGVAAALIYSIYILVGEGVMQRVAPMPAATVVMLSAAVVYAVAAVGTGLTWPASATGWLAVLAIALFSTLLAIVGFFAGLERLGAADASTLSTLEPLVTLGLAVAVLGEPLSPVQAGGAVLILSAVVYLARRPAGPGGH